ncbi:Hpt domain-containing protein [Pseudodesulfovibrio piezophilus]|uniref:Hpt protein n=1 Tax=Pseudodesulfovibrio piezophilus (strain DSM 21447 / JCM 15486 / C1TLV30) TaxID=1322246 RepID=M1WLB6_PSEP2|nr:Hpt domain-containing protein [Pseudodesulfovibrio piezophilus]CCH47580.1 Hpt protein [Pseudodesulfovibrio piezophilus C1TLV30]
MDKHEVIDSKFLDSMAGKQPFLKRMFTVFISQEPKRIQEIKDALGSQDVERLRHLAHALKGGAATMGAGRIRDCCLLLERASKAKDMNAAQSHLSELELEMRHAYAFMFNYLAEH